jgi:hypothetical protein
VKYEAELTKPSLKSQLNDSSKTTSKLKPKLRPLTFDTDIEGEPEETLLEDILNEITKDEKLLVPNKDNVSKLPLTEKELNTFRNQLTNCWVVDVGSRAANTTVKLAFAMQPDGKVVASSIELIEFYGGSEVAAFEAFQAARRAILRCQKGGYDLPIEKYDQWRNIEVAFDPQEMRKR